MVKYSRTGLSHPLVAGLVQYSTCYEATTWLNSLKKLIFHNSNLHFVTFELKLLLNYKKTNTYLHRRRTYWLIFFEKRFVESVLSVVNITTSFSSSSSTSSSSSSFVDCSNCNDVSIIYRPSKIDEHSCMHRVIHHFIYLFHNSSNMQITTKMKSNNSVLHVNLGRDYLPLIALWSLEDD